MIDYYAHSLPDQPPSHWEPLIDHLHRVTTLAAQLAGLWHGLGKYSEGLFQHAA